MLPSDFPVFPVTALIVEDEPLIAIDLGDVLTDHGVNRVGYARNLKEAIAAVAGQRWGVVLLDIGLGTQEDISLLAASLRESSVPFIFCTGYGQPPLGFEAVPLVRKPYTPAEIVAALIMADVAEKARSDDVPRLDTATDMAMRNLVHALGRDKGGP